jgi:hypothetical protein
MRNWLSSARLLTVWPSTNETNEVVVLERLQFIFPLVSPRGGVSQRATYLAVYPWPG